MSSSEAAIIAGVSAFGGGLIVALSNFVISWFHGREARRAELQRALIELWYVVSRIDYQLRSEPEPGNMESKLNENLSSRSPLLNHGIGLLRRRLLEPHLDAFVAEMTKAMAAATILAPLKLLPAMSALTEAMGAANDRDGEWQRRWDEARAQYFLQCRELLGSGVKSADPSLTE